MNSKYCIIGLPESGKSTFLAAMGYCLFSGENNNIYRLREVGNLDYLKELSNAWSEYQEMERTKLDMVEMVNISLLDKNDDEVEIIMPDLSGETFRNIVNVRKIDNDTNEMIKESDTILVFINICNIKNNMLIEEIDEKHRENVTDKVELENADKVSEEVEYVELFQIINDIKDGKIDARIIISAWDTYDNNEKPEHLLKERMPLLWQYIHNNNKLDCQFWGVSAQGGDVTKNEEIIRMSEINNACERIIVVNNDGEKSNDITKILV